jgi:hypothetical protein
LVVVAALTGPAPAPAPACTCAAGGLELQTDALVPPNARFHFLAKLTIGRDGQHRVELRDAKGAEVPLDVRTWDVAEVRFFEAVPRAALARGSYTVRLVGVGLPDAVLEERLVKVAGKPDKKPPPTPTLRAYRYTSKPVKTVKKGNVVVLQAEGCSTGHDRWLELQLDQARGKDDRGGVFYALWITDADATPAAPGTPIYRGADGDGWLTLGAASTCGLLDIDLAPRRARVRLVAIDVAGHESPPLELVFETP